MTRRFVTSQLLLASLAASAWGAGNSTNTTTGVGSASASNTTNVESSSLYYGRRAYHSLAVLGKYLYVEGGEIASGEGNSSVPAEKTVALSLYNSTKIDDITYLEINNHRPPPANNAVLWKSNAGGQYDNVMYRFGGSVPEGGKADDTNRRLWVFVGDSSGTGGGSWGIQSTNGGSVNVMDTFSFASNGLGAFCDSTGLVIGGSGTSGTDNIFTSDQRVFTPGVLTYNQPSGTWTNVTSSTNTNVTLAKASNQDWSAASRDGGQAVCVDYLYSYNYVVALGGYEQKNGSAPQLADMGQIKVYDFVNHVWFRQKASGDIPPKRSAFCAVSSSYHKSQYMRPAQDIFVYGGSDENGNALSDMYILSLPAYRWFKVNVTSPAKMHHACVMSPVPDLMIASGGFDKADSWTKDTAWPRGLGVFNLSSLQWQSEISSGWPYEQPTVIKKWYFSGGMADWDDNNESYLYGYYDYGFSNYFELSEAAKAGIIAGSVLFAVLLCGTGYWFWRWRRNKNKKRCRDMEKADLVSNGSESELSADLDRHELHEGERPELDGVARSELPNSARSELPTHDGLDSSIRDEEGNLDEESGDIADQRISPPTSPSEQTESNAALSVVSPCTPTVASFGSLSLTSGSEASPRSSTARSITTRSIKAKSIYELE